MTPAENGKMLLTWSVWPPDKDGTVADPQTHQCVVNCMMYAVDRVARLKEEYGDRLIYADVTVRLAE